MELSERLASELIQREALKILFGQLNQKIRDMSETWEEEDDDFYASLGRGDPNWSVEEIHPDNFYSGSVPSLVNSSIRKFPNCAVLCYRGNPKNSDDDTAENYTYTLSVEVMVKSESYDDKNEDETSDNEALINSRINKTMDAIHLVFLENWTLGNTISGLSAPRWQYFDPMPKREENSKGKKFFFQGGVLEYDIDKYVNLV